ncbi:radical SAM protein [Calditrichota bacterium]
MKIAQMEERLPSVRALATDCRLCPRVCGVNRLTGELGVCKITYGPVHSSVNLHRGEEPPISGISGSGTIFMTGCNLKCKFCQNFPISQLRHGKSDSVTSLAADLLKLQQQGAHNINFVTPTHQAASIYEVLLEAFRLGLSIPIVYNCGGYESLEMLKLWEGIIDVYLPDIKYGSDNEALKVSGIKEYTKFNRLAILEMQRQVGQLQLDDAGLAKSGLIIRHLVLPGDLSRSTEVLDFIANEVSPDTYISLMSQYFPANQAHHHTVLNRRVERREYNRVVDHLHKLGMYNGWIQPF